MMMSYIHECYLVITVHILLLCRFENLYLFPCMLCCDNYAYSWFMKDITCSGYLYIGFIEIWLWTFEGWKDGSALCCRRDSSSDKRWRQKNASEGKKTENWNLAVRIGFGRSATHPKGLIFLYTNSIWFLNHWYVCYFLYTNLSSSAWWKFEGLF